MGKYFTIEELSRSVTASRRGIDNTPSPDAEARLVALIGNLLDPLRAKWGAPIRVNSGFRSPALNRLVGGSATSQHMKGAAADITAGSREKNRKLFGLIQEWGLPFDQLIWEKGSGAGPDWIHVSWSARNRRQVLKIR